MTDDQNPTVDTSGSRSRSTSQPSHSSSEHASDPSSYVPAKPTPSPANANGINNSLQLPRHNFPLVPSTVRQPQLVNSPPPQTGQNGPPSPRPSSIRPSDSTSSNGQSHVTETRHITKDYDQRTGAKTINRYEFIETIGRGIHGKVKLARDVESGNLVAIKIVSRITRRRLGRWDPMEAESKIRREIAIMKKCDHPHVVALREVMDDPNSKKIYLGILTLV